MLKWAARTPQATAILSADGWKISYEELLAHGRAIAASLPRYSPDGPPVAVVMAKNREQVAGVLACLLRGNAYLPIDPFQGESRIAGIINRTKCRFALVTPDMDTIFLESCGLQCIRVDLAHAAPSMPAVDARGNGAPSSDIAYVIFTSGSTGEPKGVIISHTGAWNTCHDINERFGITPADRCLAISALGFDLSVYDIFGILGAGGSVIIPDHNRLRDPLHWLELMERDGVTVWNSVPALMQMLVQYCEDHQRRLPASLRLVMLSGDWIPVSLPERIRNLSCDTAIVSLGGATEVSIWSILHVTDHRKYEKSIPYGRPMVNQTLHVLDHLLQPRPCHVPGELYIGGIGVAEGYWGDPERTSHAFVRHPATGERLYRTGDFGRWQADGEIEFLGRQDSQVKIQGYRVELGEIEAALDTLPQVERSVVIAVGERGEAKRLAAYIVLAAGAQLNKADFRVILANRLPGYMVPSSFIVLDKFPLNENGKVDRKRLPKPAAATTKTTDTGPLNVYQRGLCGIFSKILSLPEVEPQLSFFDLGGTSLEVIKVLGAIKKTYGIEVSVADIFRYATPVVLGQHLAELIAGRNFTVSEAPSASDGRSAFTVRRRDNRRRTLASRNYPAPEPAAE